MSKPLYVCLYLTPKLPLAIRNEPGDEQPLMVGDDETLEAILDIAIDGAAYEGNWQGLVRLRLCLLKWVKETESALEQIAEEGAYRDAHPRTLPDKVKRRSCEDRRFGGECDEAPSQALARYRGDPAHPRQDHQIAGEDGQPVSRRVGLPRGRQP